MFKIAPGTKEKLLAYMKRHGISDHLPSPVVSRPHNGSGYEWSLGFFAPEQVVGWENEVLHTVDGADFVIDVAEVFLDDLRERTLTVTERGFEFVEPPRWRP